jgi:hypothetical protein
VRRWLLPALALLVAGCTIGPTSQGGQGPESFEQSRLPVCEIRGNVRVPMLVLMAQAVPTATQLPCVDLENLTAEWSISDVFVRNGRARFALDRFHDKANHAAVVVLERTCRFGQVTSGKVTRVPTDHPGIQRYQEVTEIRPGQEFRGAIYYLFRGGCVTYRLHFLGAEQARPLGDVVLALSFVPREQVAAAVREQSKGKLSLDPPPAGR